MQGERFADAKSDQTRRSGVFGTTNTADFKPNLPVCSGTDEVNIPVSPVNLVFVLLCCFCVGLNWLILKLEHAGNGRWVILTATLYAENNYLYISDLKAAIFISPQYS